MADSARVELDFRVGGTDHCAYFQSNGCPVEPTPEARVTASLLSCMSVGAPCSAGGRLSPRLMASLEEIQDIFSTWWAELATVPVHSPGPRHAPSADAGRRVGVFFSGGVDSFYTLIKHRDEITDLIFVHGFDIRLGQTVLRQASAAAVERVGEAFGKRVIQVETNLRPTMDPYVDWGQAHGAALATVGHMLSGAIRRIYIPASHTYGHLLPWGSHPLLDRLWGTEFLEFVHDGAEATRVRKVEVIAEDELALQSLRVCWLNPDEIYNCGKCEKCLRTMINLRVVGALERCTTFPVPLDLERVRAIDVSDENIKVFFTENLAAVERGNVDPSLAAALREVLYGPALKTRFIRAVRRSLSRPRHIVEASARRLRGSRFGRAD